MLGAPRSHPPSASVAHCADGDGDGIAIRESAIPSQVVLANRTALRALILGVKATEFDPTL
jgi:hypothetical protein